MGYCERLSWLKGTFSSHTHATDSGIVVGTMQNRPHSPHDTLLHMKLTQHTQTCVCKCVGVIMSLLIVRKQRQNYHSEQRCFKTKTTWKCIVRANTGTPSVFSFRNQTKENSVSDKRDIWGLSRHHLPTEAAKSFIRRADELCKWGKIWE